MANEYILSLLLKLNDKLTKPLKDIDQETQKRLKEMADGWEKTGKAMTKFFTVPFIAGIGGTLFLMDRQVKAEALLANAIKITNKESSISVDNLKNLAAELQKVTTYGDEASISALALVQQLSDLNEQQLMKLLPAMQDMASAMNLDLQTTASLIGKTLGSTTNALSRYGIQFDSTLPKAQKFDALLKSMNEKFKGTSETLAKEGLGNLTQFKNLLGDAGERVGKLILPVFNDFINNVLKPLLSAFNRLDDSTKRLILGFLGVAAAIGPLLLLGSKLIRMFMTPITPIQQMALALGLLATGFMFLIEVMQKAKTQHADQAEALKNELEETNNLKSEYEQLSKKTKLNMQEKQRMITIETILKKRIGDTAFVIDEQTGKLKLNTEAFDENAKRKEELILKQLELQAEQDKKAFESYKVSVQLADAVKKNNNDLMNSLINKYAELTGKRLSFQEVLGMGLVTQTEEFAKKMDEAELAYLNSLGKVEAMKDAMDGVKKSTEEVEEEINKAPGINEETPLLMLPTKVKKKLDEIKNAASESTIDIAASSSYLNELNKSSSVDVRIVIETAKEVIAKIGSMSRTGDANVEIDINNVLGETTGGV